MEWLHVREVTGQVQGTETMAIAGFPRCEWKGQVSRKNNG